MGYFKILFDEDLKTDDKQRRKVHSQQDMCNNIPPTPSVSLVSYAHIIFSKF